MNYATELARISTQPQNYSDENWDEAMMLCDNADREIATLQASNEQYLKLVTDLTAENIRYRKRAKDAEEEYVPMCRSPKHDSSGWPCPEICGEMCIYWCTDKCKEKE